jgi:hypothetical protein
MTKQARWQASRYQVLATHAATTRAHTQGGEDPDDGLHLLSRSCHRNGSPASHEGGQTEAVEAKPLSASPPLTTDRVDKMYHQLPEIHAITAAQLVECTCWHRSDPASRLVRAGSADTGPPPCLL